MKTWAVYRKVDRLFLDNVKAVDINELIAKVHEKYPGSLPVIVREFDQDQEFTITR